MKRIPRDPLRFNIFGAFAGYGQTQRVSLRSPKTADEFIGKVHASLKNSLNSETFLQGLRTEAMFEALVVNLGSVRMLKEEDGGEVYSTDDTLKVADFRLILSDGTQLLVEVKNFYQGEAPFKMFSMTDVYFQGLNRYAQLMSIRLKMAVYWARWNIWTLVSPAAFKQRGTRWILDMKEAIPANEMSTLGDVHVGTRFPLELRLVADKAKPRSIDQSGNAVYTVGAVEMFCEGAQIASQIEQGIALFLMLYGDWPCPDPNVEVVENQIEAVRYCCAPEEDHHQGFEMIGSLSSMFSNFYKFSTSNDGKIVQLGVDVTPGSLGRLIPQHYRGEALPLWRIVQQAK